MRVRHKKAHFAYVFPIFFLSRRSLAIDRSRRKDGVVGDLKTRIDAGLNYWSGLGLFEKHDELSPAHKDVLGGAASVL